MSFYQFIPIFRVLNPENLRKTRKVVKTPRNFVILDIFEKIIFFQRYAIYQHALNRYLDRMIVAVALQPETGFEPGSYRLFCECHSCTPCGRDDKCEKRNTFADFSLFLK